MTNYSRFIYSIVFVLFTLAASSQIRDGEVRLNMQHIGHQNDHSEYFLPADAPEVFYNSDEMEIIIVADGFSSYYNVLIIRNSTNQTMASTQISGYGDTIDVSVLPSDNFTIVITSEYNNVFEGQFTIL